MVSPIRLGKLDHSGPVCDESSLQSAEEVRVSQFGTQSHQTKH